MITPYAPEHADGVLHLLNANGWNGNAAPSADLLSRVSKRGAAFLATDGAEVIGFARVLSDGEVVSYLSELVTDADWRGQGVGRALVQACRDRFPAARLDLLSTEMARGFYEHLGFGWHVGYRRWP